MFRTLLWPALLAALLATTLPALAQSESAEAAPSPSAPGEDTPTAPTEGREEATLEQELGKWTRVLERVRAQLDDNDLSLGSLSVLEETVDQVRKQIDEAREPVQSEVEAIRALVAALGPPPKEGEPPEAENVAAERLDLNRQLGPPEGQLKKLDVLFEKTNLLDGRIAKAWDRNLRAQLLVRTPPLLAPETWSRASSEFATLARQALSSPKRWYESPRVRAVVGTGYFATALVAVFAAAISGWYLRRWVVGRFGRKAKIEEPSYRMRVLAAIAVATANTAIPILVVAVAYGALWSRDLLFGAFDHLVLGIVLAVVAFSVLRGLPRAMLSPGMPQWRLIQLGGTAARLWYRRALVLAVIVSIDTLITVPIEALEPTVWLVTVHAFVSNCAMSVVFLAVVVDRRLWLTPEEEARATAIETGQPPGPSSGDSAGRSRWWIVGRVLVGGLALAIPITGLAGYGVLADHIARRLLASAGVLLVGIILHNLACDLVAVFTREDEKPLEKDEAGSPLYVWTVLLLDIGLVAAIAVFLVPLWGGRWDNIFERIGWALSGIRIGERTFSLGDVLLGIVVFILLLMLARFIQRFINRRVLKQTRMDVGVRDAINTGIGYAGFVIAALVAIDTAGIDLSGLAIIAGALSVGIGFGMQSVVNNFVSGLILLVERPIKVGDWIVVGQDQGTVKRISVRSTQIQTFSNASVIIPNSELIAGRVTNWMYKDNSGRVELPIGVAYGSDTAKVRDILIDCAKAHSDVKAWPQPYVVFMDFGDSALLFQLRFFIRDINLCLSISSDLRFAIDAAFREAGINIPFPQRDVHIYDASRQADPVRDEPNEPDTPPPPGKVLPIRGGRSGKELPTDGDSEA